MKKACDLPNHIQKKLYTLFLIIFTPLFLFGIYSQNLHFAANKLLFSCNIEAISIKGKVIERKDSKGYYWLKLEGSTAPSFTYIFFNDPYSGTQPNYATRPEKSDIVKIQALPCREDHWLGKEIYTEDGQLLKSSSAFESARRYAWLIILVYFITLAFFLGYPAYWFIKLWQLRKSQ